MFGARRMLEGGVVRRLCCSPPKDGLGALIGCVDAEDCAQSKEDLAIALRLSGDFHLILAKLTGNPIVAGMLRELVSRTVLAIAVHQRPNASGCRTHEHRRIINLLKAGDAEGAAREMDDHLVALDAGLDVAPHSRNNPSLRDVLQAIVNSHPRRRHCQLGPVRQRRYGICVAASIGARVLARKRIGDSGVSAGRWLGGYRS